MLADCDTFDAAYRRSSRPIGTLLLRHSHAMATKSSSILLLSVFEAALYRLRIAPSTSVLVAVLISPTISMPPWFG